MSCGSSSGVDGASECGGGEGLTKADLEEFLQELAAMMSQGVQGMTPPPPPSATGDAGMSFS